MLKNTAKKERLNDALIKNGDNEKVSMCQAIIWAIGCITMCCSIIYLSMEYLDDELQTSIGRKTQCERMMTWQHFKELVNDGTIQEKVEIEIGASVKCMFRWRWSWDTTDWVVIRDPPTRNVQRLKAELEALRPHIDLTTTPIWRRSCAEEDNSMTWENLTDMIKDGTIWKLKLIKTDKADCIMVRCVLPDQKVYRITDRDGQDVGDLASELTALSIYGVPGGSKRSIIQRGQLGEISFRSVTWEVQNMSEVQ